MFIAAMSAIAKLWKQPRCPLTDEWIKKISHTHTHTEEYYSVIKNDEILPFTMKWLELEGIMLSKQEKDDYHNVSLICGI